MWPVFAAVTAVDGLLLHLLPPVRTGVDPIPALLLATFGNLILVGLAAPWLARRIRARRGATPGAPEEAEREVLTDRAGTGLLLAGVLGVLAAGLAARPTVVSETEATEEAARAIHRYVQRSGNEELIRNEETAHTDRLADGYFRICIARDERGRWFCYFVDTRREPTEIVRDPSAEPNLGD